MVLGLAMNIAKDLTGPSIREAIRRVHTPGGTLIGTGPAEFKKAIDLIKAGRPIKYTGATGPLEFDANGDVTGPALVWKITGGKIETDRIISIEDMQGLMKRVEN
jgi:branched-chain amino acid transport system substrate-binding protein